MLSIPAAQATAKGQSTMGIKIPTTVRRYRVNDRMRFGLEQLIEKLESRKFMPLGESIEDQERWGWITPEHLLDTRFDIGKCVREPYVVFALRIDKRRVPAPLVRAYMKIEEEAHRATTGKPMKPTARREMRDDITMRLLERILPQSTAIPVIWSPSRQRVFFGSTSARTNDLFKPLFEDTFDLELTPMCPAGSAIALAQGRDDLVENLALLTPVCFLTEEEAFAQSAMAAGGVQENTTVRQVA